MDLNLQFWRNEGQTFSQRLRHWIEILDPLVVFVREADINTSRDLLRNSGENATSLQDKKIKDAWKISLTCVNPSTGDTIPFFFRGGAFVCIAASLVAVASLPYKRFWSSFSRQEFSWKQALLSVGSIPGLALIGALPNYIIERKKSLNTPAHFFSKVMASCLMATLCAFNVFTMRNFEHEKGIKVMDSTGEVIGMSRVAGKKALRETALSRGMLFGVPMMISETTVYLINRRRVFPQRSVLLRVILTYFFCWLILPVSLSCIPQLREIKRNELEPDLVSSTKETFFYYRGV
ncbi:sideroflexin-4 isoform 2-T2 [Liasis olivaceus]